jgi:hypothetical protein
VVSLRSNIKNAAMRSKALFRRLPGDRWPILFGGGGVGDFEEKAVISFREPLKEIEAMGGSTSKR